MDFNQISENNLSRDFDDFEIQRLNSVLKEAKTYTIELLESRAITKELVEEKFDRVSSDVS